MIPKGYKQTEIGVIPEDWDVRKIGDFTDATAGGTPSTSHPEYWNGEILWMSSGELNNRRIYNVLGRITELGYNNSSTHMIPENCVLIGLAGQGKTRGTVAVNYVELCTNQSIAAIFPSKEHNSEYLYQNLWSRYEELRELSSGDGGRGGLNLTIIKNFPCAFPELQEQNRIADALSDVDSMISSLEKLIAKKKAVKQGAMQKLLTGKKRLPGFSGEWKSILLEDVCVFYNGGTPSKKRSDWWNGCIPWISSSDLCENSITSVSINRYITQDALDHSATRLCPKNAVSIVSRVGVGKVAVTPCELCTSQDFTTIVSSAHNPYFLAYMLVPIMKDMAMQAQGTSIKGVTVEDIAKIKISTPSIKEQNQIVSILSDMDNEIEALEQKLAKTRQIKQGMMQQLLTGKIRLV